MRLTFKSGAFEESRLPSMRWVGLFQSVEGLNRTKKADLALELQRQLFPRSCLPAWQILDLSAFITV